MEMPYSLTRDKSNLTYHRAKKGLIPNVHSQINDYPDDPWALMDNKHFQMSSFCDQLEGRFGGAEYEFIYKCCFAQGCD